jgi:hypothetical protein
MRALLFAVVLCGLSWADPTRPQRPVNNPRPGRTYETTPARRIYLFQGTLQSISPYQCSVSGAEDGKSTTLQFRPTEGGKMPEGFKAGDEVLVNYNYTMESGVYELINLRHRPAAAP